jgi:putative endopeptidase
MAEFRRQRDRHDGPVDKLEWGMNPQTVNAYYHPLNNQIVFPAAILQPPFFNMEADDAVNYGAIGAVIGHEIGHGFDDSGSTFDGDGVLRNWWTDEDRAAFEKRTGALVSQYNEFMPFEDLPVNGEFTQGENIGDLGGITIGLLAYQMSLDGEEAPVIDGFTGPQRAASSATRSYAGALPPTRIPRRSIEPTARFVTCRNGMKRLMSQRRMRCTCHRKSA